MQAALHEFVSRHSGAAVILGLVLVLAHGGPQDPGAQPHARAASAKAAASTVPSAPMSLPLKDVTSESGPLIEAAATRLVRPLWRCDGCGALGDEHATCATCKRALTELADAPVLRRLAVDAQKQALELELAPGQTLRLSEIEQVVSHNGGALLTDQLALANFSKLVVQVPRLAGDVSESVRTALDDSKLFARTSVRFDPQRSEVVALVETGTTPAHFGEAAKALAQLGDGYRLADVAWTAPCERCAKSGAVQAGCRACWREPKTARG